MARQLSWAASLREEATIEDDFITVVVNHVTKGRTSRFFFSDEKVRSVYLWVGSLSPYPEYFTLSLKKPDNILHPSEGINTVERNIIMMNSVENDPPKFFQELIGNPSNVTEVIDAQQMSTSMPANMESQSDRLLSCPICGERKSAKEIETHASNCAERKYIQIQDSDDSETDENDTVTFKGEKAAHTVNEGDVLLKLQDKIREIFDAAKKKGVSIKVRRNFEFSDFCERFSKQWIRNSIGNIFVVKYFGESGIDEGGLRREFFTGDFFSSNIYV